MSAPLSIISDLFKSDTKAAEILHALMEAGWVCAPIILTQKMIDAAWADAHEEDAAGVWREMISSVLNDVLKTYKDYSAVFWLQPANC
jgi:hypothetical protein